MITFDTKEAERILDALNAACEYFDKRTDWDEDGPNQELELMIAVEDALSCFPMDGSPYVDDHSVPAWHNRP